MTTDGPFCFAVWHSRNVLLTRLKGAHFWVLISGAMYINVNINYGCLLVNAQLGRECEPSEDFIIWGTTIHFLTAPKALKLASTQSTHLVLDFTLGCFTRGKEDFEKDAVGLHSKMSCPFYFL